jgi:hypothetical protein
MMPHPETTPTIMGHEPVAANALIDTAAWADLSDCKGLLITISHFRGGDTDLVLDVHEGDTAAGTTAVAENFDIWYASSALTDPTMVKQTSAKNFTINTGDFTGSQIVCFYLSAASCKRYVQLGSSDGHGSSLVSVTYQKVGARYQGNESY